MNRVSTLISENDVNGITIIYENKTADNKKLELKVTRVRNNMAT